MKQLVEYLLSKKKQEITSELKDFCAVRAYNQYYDLLMRDWKDTLVYGKDSPNLFIMKRTDAKEYSKSELVMIYAIPEQYESIDDFCEAYECGEITDDDLAAIKL